MSQRGDKKPGALPTRLPRGRGGGGGHGGGSSQAIQARVLWGLRSHSQQRLI